MKKGSLKDMKKQNRQLILQSLMEHGGLSRVEITGNTELSASTVTTLTAELLEEKLLIENGVTVSTGGRRRVELTINPQFGVILVLEIRRNEAQVHFYDMLLTEMRCVTIANYYTSGNDLLIALTAVVMDNFSIQQLHSGKLAGIGLLYADDLHANDCSVMYSTSLSSASISLREAVFTQFRVPITEEYAAANSVTAVLQPEKALAQNSVHIALQQNVLASIVLNGSPIPMRGGAQADITQFVHSTRNDLLPSDCKKVPAISHTAALVQKVSAFVAFLCTMFPLDIVLLSGSPTKEKAFVRQVAQALQQKLRPLPSPEVRGIVPDESGAAHRMAQSVRRKILVA